MVSIRELLDKFDLKLDLSKQVLELNFDGDYVEYSKKMEQREFVITDLDKNKLSEVYIFKSDVATIYICPEDLLETVKHIRTDLGGGRAYTGAGQPSTFL